MKKSAAKSFLIIKMSSLGDILQCFDAAVYLKTQDPYCHVSWVVEKRFEEIVRLHPCVDEVISCDIKAFKKSPFAHRQEIMLFRRKLKEKAYAAAFDLQGNLKSALVMMHVRAQDKVGYTFKEAPEWISSLFVTIRFPIPRGLTITRQYLSFLRNYFDEELDWEHSCYRLKLPAIDPKLMSTFIMVCPGSHWKSKQLKMSTMKEFLYFLHKHTKKKIVVVWQTSGECIENLAQGLEGQIEQRADLNLSKWAHMMQHAEVVVSVDSSALHLAAVLNKPTFSMFGPSSRSLYQPQGHFHAGVEGECPYEIHFSKRCPHLRTCKSYACIQDISLKLLEAAFKRLYSQVRVKSIIDEDPQLRPIDQNLYETPQGQWRSEL